MSILSSQSQSRSREQLTPTQRQRLTPIVEVARAVGPAVVNVYQDVVQEVDLEIYNLANLNAKTQDDPTWGIASTDAKLYKLIVEIKDQGKTVDTFEWWLTP